MAKIFGIHSKAPSTNWTTFSVTITGSSSNPTKGSIVIDQGYWRRVGDSVQIRYEFSQNGAGSAGSGTYQFSLPAGLVIDTTKCGSSGSAYSQSFGGGEAFDGTTVFALMVLFNTTTTVKLAGTTTSGFIGSAVIPLSGNTARYGFECTLPIVGWAANDILRTSDDTKI